MSKDAPAVPDAAQTSAQQTAANIAAARETAKMNAIDQTNAYGSTTFLRDENGVPIGQTSTLSPELQKILEGKQGQALGINDATSQLIGNLDTNGINAPGVNDVGRNAYESIAGWLRPEFEQQNKQLGIQLDQRGLPIGSEARAAAEGAAQRNQNQALTQAAAQAQVQGANEQNTLFNQEVTKNQNGYQNLAQLLSANPGNSLLSSAPGAINTSPVNVAATDVAGNVYKSYQAQAAAEQQKQQNIMGAVQGAASMAMMFSDENYKENRQPADGESVLLRFRDLPVDHYDYKQEARDEINLPESRTGPMAQDWARQFGGDGHEIDMGDMMGQMLAAIKALDARTAQYGGS